MWGLRGTTQNFSYKSSIGITFRWFEAIKLGILLKYHIGYTLDFAKIDEVGTKHFWA